MGNVIPPPWANTSGSPAWPLAAPWQHIQCHLSSSLLLCPSISPFRHAPLQPLFHPSFLPSFSLCPCPSLLIPATPSLSPLPPFLPIPSVLALLPVWKAFPASQSQTSFPVPHQMGGPGAVQTPAVLLQPWGWGRGCTGRLP